jgi:hypothetical protein
VPLVFGAAGPAEIVQDGVNGRHWRALDELAEQTVELAADDTRRGELATGAVGRADDFSASAFADRLAGHLATDSRSGDVAHHVDEDVR